MLNMLQIRKYFLSLVMFHEIYYEKLSISDVESL